MVPKTKGYITIAYLTIELKDVFKEFQFKNSERKYMKSVKTCLWNGLAFLILIFNHILFEDRTRKKNNAADKNG